MNLERFEILRDEFLQKESDTLISKEKEYTKGDEDRLLNFKQVAALEGREAHQVAVSYLLKHVQSIALAVATGKYAWCWKQENGNEGLKERIVDARNYLVLLAACIEEAEGRKSGT